MFKCALGAFQSSMKEVVSVSNMGVSKGRPIIEDRDRLLLKFTDGSACMSDGQKLSYSTLIYLVCSRGAQVRSICASHTECIFFFFFLALTSLIFSVSVAICVVEGATFPDVPELHRVLHVGDQSRLRCRHHQERREFTCSIPLVSWDELLLRRAHSEMNPPILCQNCAVVDPNTGFEFNLQLLASENGYTTTANGKEFLVRKMLERDRRFCAALLLHLRVPRDPAGKHLRKRVKVRGWKRRLRAGKRSSYESGRRGEEPPVLHQRPAHPDVQGSTGQSHRCQHGHTAQELLLM